jgi:hypothetical protein
MTSTTYPSEVLGRKMLALLFVAVLVLSMLMASVALARVDQFGGSGSSPTSVAPYAPYTAGPVVSEEPYAPYTAGPVVRESAPYAPYTAGPVVEEPYAPYPLAR